MCGLFGGASTQFLSKPEIDNIKTLAIVSCLRGTDSAGIVWETAKGRESFSIHKDTLNAIDVFEEAQVFMEKGPHPAFIMGHTRYATHGSVTKENAHPFQIDHIVGSHNGMAPIFAEKGDDRPDSYHIFHNLAKKGLEHTLQRLSSASDSSFALTWIDRKDRTINIIRNDSRPLYMMRSLQGGIYWASEVVFLAFMADRTNQTFHDPYLIPEGRLITIPIGQARVTEKDLSHLTKKRTYEFVPKITYKKETGKVITLPGPKILADKGVTSNTLDALFPEPSRTYPGFNNKMLAIPEASKLLDRGCCWCSSRSTISDKVTWIDPVSHLCSDCKEDEWVLQYIAGLNDPLPSETGVAVH